MTTAAIPTIMDALLNHLPQDGSVHLIEDVAEAIGSPPTVVGRVAAKAAAQGLGVRRLEKGGNIYLYRMPPGAVPIKWNRTSHA